MFDLSALRQMARSAPEVTINSETLLKLLDAIETIQVQLVPAAIKREPKPGNEADERCARWMFEVMQAINPTAKVPNFNAWARDVRLMRECDDRTHKEIGGLFRWAQQHSFWNANIQSPAKLRKQWDTLVMQRRRDEAPKQPSQLGKQGQTTAKNAQRWLEEHGHAA